MTEVEPLKGYPKYGEADPSTLQPNPWNTNIMTPENEQKLEASMKRFGIFRPVVVREIVNSRNGDKTLQILGGQHRNEIAQRQGRGVVPIVNLGPIDEEKAKEIGIADNARYGVDDAIAFGELIKSLAHADQLADFLPYTQNEFDSFVTSSEIDLDSLDFEENFEKSEENDTSPQPETEKPAKTHTILRFKCSNRDAEDITARIEAVKQAQGFIGSDDLTNAGDALAHLLLHAVSGQSNLTDDLEDIDAGDDE
jgi:hypothetical protein